MAEKKLYFYDLINDEVTIFDLFDAVLSVPLDSFPHVDGCTSKKNINLLTPENIGKKFKLSILDPIEIGVCAYLGKGYDAIPEEWIKIRLESEIDQIERCFYVFQTLNNEIVITDEFDVEPLF